MSKEDVLKGNAAYTREMRPYETYRVGNFKLRLVKLLIDDKGDSKEELKGARYKEQWLEKMHYSEEYAVRVMSLEETWCVRIPEHYGSFSVIVDLFRRGGKNAEDILTTVFCNIGNVCIVMDGFYHNMVLYAARMFVEHEDKTKGYEEKKKAYAAIVNEISTYLDNDLVLYKQDNGKPDLMEQEYKQDETKDMLAHDKELS